MNRIEQINKQRKQEVGEVVGALELKQQIERVLKGLKVEILDTHTVPNMKLYSFIVVPENSFFEAEMLENFLYEQGIEIFYSMFEVYQTEFRVEMKYTDEQIRDRVCNMLGAYKSSIIYKFTTDTQCKMDAAQLCDESILISYEDIGLEVDINTMQPLSSSVYCAATDRWENEEFVAHYVDDYDMKNNLTVWREITK